MITTEITSVTTDVLKGVIINKLLPNIIKMFTRDLSTITIQLDGSGAHSIHDDNDIKGHF